jgi:DNA polymerase-1
MDRLFVIDASAYLYSAYFAIRNMTNAKGESTNALFGFVRSLTKLMKDFSPHHLVAVFDGPQCSKPRKELYSEYKAHRQGMPDDLFYQIERAQLMCRLLGVPWLSIPEVEADDTIGSIAVWAEELGSSVYLCSGDKDLCQLVNDKVFVLNTYKDNFIIGSKEVEAIHGVPPTQMIDYLAIVGDASDNVPGLPGFGPKTASKFLKQFGTLENMLANAAAITEPKKRQTAVEQADLARLSKKLVTINCHVDIPLTVDFYTLITPLYSELREFYASMNFQSLIREIDLHQNAPSTELPEYYKIVDDPQNLKELISYLSQQKEVCFDTQTSSDSPLRTDLVGISFGVEPGKAWYVPLNGKLGQQAVLESVKPLFENPDIGFYGHNAKFDLHVLSNCGINVANLCFDTILASYLLNAQSRQHSLDALSLELFNKIKIPLKDLIGKGKSIITIGEVPIEKMAVYCCEDVDYTVRLKSHFTKEIAERGLENLFYTLELPLLKVLAKMEQAGIYLDVAQLKTMSTELTSQIGTLQSEIYCLAGEEFNINSPKQLIAIFQKLDIRSAKKTAAGQMKTDSDVLESLSNEYPIAGKLLEYRALEKLRSTYVDSLPNDVNPRNDRIHCTFNQSVAATGRLSCQDPNLQNIPVRSALGKRIREAFRPQKEGWSYLAADYSQIELRLLAHYCEDPHLLWAFSHDEDVHAHTASVIFNVPFDQVTKELRQQAKAVNFGVIYGQQAFGLSQELGIDMKAASEFIHMYFQRYSHVRHFVESSKEKARQSGKAVTLTGRERLIPEINSRNVPLRLAAERLAINTPLQGTAADIIKLAMLECDRLITEKKMQAMMVLQIHDELIFELPDSEILEAKKIVKSAMEGVMTLKVPLLVDISIGKNWKEC